jgi:hypothetical protein
MGWRQHGFEKRGHGGEAMGLDDEVPQSLEFLPARRIEEVLGLMLEAVMGESAARDVAPAVEIPIGAVIS